ncbi:MAG: ABC transporter permease [Candidatus Bathyarchaeota archaeon]|nr:ABC transporter permease [Candidatus Bathyarchaeum sp.]
MWKSFIITKEDVFDKKLSILGVGILVGLMGLYIINMFNSLDISQLEDYINSLPESMLALLGGELDITNPYSLLSSYIYSFMWLYCGIYLVYVASSLLPQDVENHTIDLTLSKPVSREEYLLGKISFIYVFIIGLMAIITVFVALGMVSSDLFIQEGLYWDRVAVVFLITTLHLGTLVMTAVFASTIFLDAKKTTLAAVIVMFIMFFIGDFSPVMSPDIGKTMQYFSTWFYYDTAQLFGAGNYANLGLDVLVLGAINVALVIGSLIVFRKRDIPV